MYSSKIKKFFIPFFLIILTVLTRFYNLNWGNGYFFNPDENNMAFAISQMTLLKLDPHFFAYGQFPLFLTFFTTPFHNFSTIVLTLRFWSAVFSSLSILFFYLIAKDIFKSKIINFIFVLLLIFTPGLIQSSHFGTTESLLIFVFSVNIFLSLKYFENQKNRYFLFSVLISAIGLGSKITAVFFIIPFYLSLFLVFLKKLNSLPVKGGAPPTGGAEGFNLIFSFFIFTLLTSLLSLLFSPFNIINFSEFKSSMNYETSVAIGKTSVFYTQQFNNTIPYIFQFQKVFPYVNGIFIFIFSFIGFFICFIHKSFFVNHKSKLVLILFPSIIYFIYTGQLFVKWSRFMSPLFFIGPFFCLFIFQKLKNKFLKIILLLIMVSPGIYFFQKYFLTDSRIIASDWMKSNISSDSFVLSESGNVVNLPLSSFNFEVNNFDFYDPKNIKNLSSEINKSDYITIPSRRVFKNDFPETKNYYQNLFSQNLGFVEIKKVNHSIDLFLNSENAEETWSVFDNPTIRIYQKNIHLNFDDYQKMLITN